MAKLKCKKKHQACKAKFLKEMGLFGPFASPERYRLLSATTLVQNKAINS
jgi:hypothetical protein